jgi:hypothetical protein
MRKLPRERGHRLFETLESRRLLSVTVSPGYHNDTQSIQNAINSAGQGGTVQLTAGTFNISSTLNLNGCTLAGVAGKTVLQWSGGNNYLAAIGSNAAITGVTFNGGGLQISDKAQNLTVNSDTFENINGFDAYHDNGITATGGFDNASITNNAFTNISGDGAYLFSMNNSHFDSNTLSDCFEGVHAINFAGASAGNNCTFNYNTLTGISRHGIEIQNPWFNLSVGWNTLSDFNVQPGGNSHIALSIATGPDGGTDAQNVDVHDNVILGTGPGVPSSPNTDFTAIEIMGSGSIVNHNYIANWGWGVLDGFTTNWQVTNNSFVNVTSQNGAAVPESNATSPSVTSGNTWSSTWDGKVPSSFAIAGSNTSSSTTSSSSSAASTAPTTGNDGWLAVPAAPAQTAPASSKPAKSSGSGNGKGSGSSSFVNVIRQTFLGEL